MQLRKVLFVTVFIPMLNACNGGGLGAGVSGAQDVTLPSSTAPISSTLPPAPTPAPTPSPTDPVSTIVGDSCENSGKTCLALHFVSYLDSSKKPTASQEQAANIIRGVNQVYAQCNLAFQIENYEAVDPTQFKLAYGAESQNQLDQIRKTFDSPVSQLLVVTTGPWGTAVNGWSNMPGDGIYGAILEASIVNYGNGILYAHELGHYLGLYHLSSSGNLMNPVIYTSSTSLTQAQCQSIMTTVSDYWSEMVRK